ncbi:MAG: LacI family DNA-binding transcriptional regulator [Propionibacteriaceae bacterium]|nr:LacI family DNA-binding transcriptional regulator [Propionibacteriaceae bacterium]
MNRPTIRDIATAAGVSPAAASFALNDRSGVSEATRERVKRIASDLNWTPNAAAVALSAGKSGAVGLVIARPEESFTGERFFIHLIAGIERVLTARSRSLVLLFVDGVDEEMACYRRWWSEKRVDGVILTDPRADDPRPALLDEIGLSAVYVGAQSDSTLPHVRVDDAAAMTRLVDHFADLGHTRLAHVCGSFDYVHTRRRVEVFASRCATWGISVAPTVTTNYSEEAGRAMTQSLLSSPQPPTGIIFDNEVLALGGLVAILEAAVRIPEDVAVASFEDSPLCRIVRPSITALVRDPAELGTHATSLLLDLLDGREAAAVVAPTMDLSIRGSTDPRLGHSAAHVADVSEARAATIREVR